MLSRRALRSSCPLGQTLFPNKPLILTDDVNLSNFALTLRSYFLLVHTFFTQMSGRCLGQTQPPPKHTEPPLHTTPHMPLHRGESGALGGVGSMCTQGLWLDRCKHLKGKEGTQWRQWEAWLRKGDSRQASRGWGAANTLAGKRQQRCTHQFLLSTRMLRHLPPPQRICGW